jgi:hypothetical protein
VPLLKNIRRDAPKANHHAGDGVSAISSSTAMPPFDDPRIRPRWRSPSTGAPSSTSGRGRGEMARMRRHPTACGHAAGQLKTLIGYGDVHKSRKRRVS